MGDSNALHHLAPIARNPAVSRLWIVRHAQIGLDDNPKVEQIVINARLKWWRLLKMLWACLRLARREKVRAFVSFNPFPYGLLSYLAARLYGKAVHLGFVGSDWNLYAKRRLGRWLLPAVCHADWITVPGEAMLTEMRQHGIDEGKVAILPHGTDFAKFPVAQTDGRQYSCVFVGSLIEIKRVDLILRAFGEVVRTHAEARLCIVGDGPLMNELKSVADDLQIAHAVDFVGYQKDVYPYLAAAKMILIASRAEGFPFVLVEAICTGVVPVCTPVGSIPEHVDHEKTGLLFPQDDAAALAACIRRLLDDQALYARLRENVLALRPHYGYEAATEVWDAFFRGVRCTPAEGC